MDHFVSAAQLTQAVEAVMLGRPAPAVTDGWSVRWMGWAFGIFVLALARGGACAMSAGKRARDVAISFLIPTAILVVVFWQVSAFYGDRFNLRTNLANFRLGLPDVFILLLIGTLPDYAQGFAKVRWTLTDRKPPAQKRHESPGVLHAQGEGR